MKHIHNQVALLGCLKPRGTDEVLVNWACVTRA